MSERRRLERDLHDGVQNELVALIIKLATAQEDPRTPPAVVDMLGGLEVRAQAALDTVRNVVRGIYPPLLADFGVRDALRTQATSAPIDVRLAGSAPRSAPEAEEAVYFACLEALQNAVKHAGLGASVTVLLSSSDDSLAVHIADDGHGFDPAVTTQGAGVRNIHDRIHQLGGTVELSSSPGQGTFVTIAVPWPARR